MFLLQSVVVVLYVRLNVEADNITSKNINFVDVLKQNLKQNNDDYVEMEITKRLTSSTTRSDVLKNKVVRGVKNGFYRRGGDGLSWELNYNDITTKASTIKANKSDSPVVSNDVLRMRSNKKLPINRFLKQTFIKNNISRVNEMIPNVNIITNNTKDLHSKYTTFVNKEGIDEFKKFMVKNKDLLKIFLNSKLEAQTDKVKFNAKESELKLGVLRNKMNVNKSVRAREDDEDKLPNPEILDMAPAKGGRIFRMRLKDRLCHRHVLMPEGPKYDSNGRWYVPEHRLVARHLYDVTPRPRLLLPRCCNCCKKSVLGCE